MVTKATPDKGRRGRQARNYLAEAIDKGTPVFPFVEGLSDAEKEIWVSIVNTRTGDYWNAGDVPILKMYCRLTADIERLTEEIRDEGEIIHNMNGNAVVNPKLIVRGNNERLLMTLCTKLRLQPSSRVSSEGEKHQTKKKNRANAAASTIDDDEDGLLASGGMMQ